MSICTSCMCVSEREDDKRADQDQGGEHARRRKEKCILKEWKWKGTLARAPLLICMHVPDFSHLGYCIQSFGEWIQSQFNCTFMRRR